mmetsp:Transcript_108010/g.241012  ORF Transcript_108010/g.241012 Transcript_108010/m.241012 type:complete len:242 (+) Transcript_108010:3299-4024(+)
MATAESITTDTLDTLDTLNSNTSDTLKGAETEMFSKEKFSEVMFSVVMFSSDSRKKVTFLDSNSIAEVTSLMLRLMLTLTSDTLATFASRNSVTVVNSSNSVTEMLRVTFSSNSVTFSSNSCRCVPSSTNSVMRNLFTKHLSTHSWYPGPRTVLFPSKELCSARHNSTQGTVDSMKSMAESDALGPVMLIEMFGGVEMFSLPISSSISSSNKPGSESSVTTETDSSLDMSTAPAETLKSVV